MPNEKILIVDDSKDILEGLKMFLELKNYQVETVVHAHDLETQIPAFQPSIIILDIFISGVDGRHICAGIKKNPATESIKVILSSAAPHALTDFKTFGADDILQKPFGLEEIYQKIEKVLIPS